MFFGFVLKFFCHKMKIYEFFKNKFKTSINSLKSLDLITELNFKLNFVWLKNFRL
jgi:hypothetical protein